MKYLLGDHEHITEVSLPTRERGLKLSNSFLIGFCFAVAPYAGAWIEIAVHKATGELVKVAPYAGAWIEIEVVSNMEISKKRRSLRGSVD